LPAAQAAQASRSTKVDDILAVDVAVADPRAMAATWAAIIGLDPPAETAETAETAGAAIAFSRRTIRFVPVTSGRTGIVAVDMHATDRDHGVGQQGELCNTLIRFV
jgi:hypothetical protein